MTFDAVVTTELDSLFVARRPLRILADDATAEWFEVTIHTARSWALVDAEMSHQGVDDRDIRRWMERLKMESSWGADPITLARILETGYLESGPPLGRLA